MLLVCVCVCDGREGVRGEGGRKGGREGGGKGGREGGGRRERKIKGARLLLTSSLTLESKGAIL